MAHAYDRECDRQAVAYICRRYIHELDALPTPCLFDVTHYESLRHPDLQDHIDRVGVEIYRQGPVPAVLSKPDS